MFKPSSSSSPKRLKDSSYRSRGGNIYELIQLTQKLKTRLIQSMQKVENQLIHLKWMVNISAHQAHQKD
jgi:hypothetical protein